MSEIDDRIAKLKSRIDAGRMAKARAEATRESAQATEAQAMAKLADQYGVDNLAGARDKLVELQTQLQALTDEITAELDVIEESQIFRS